MAAVLGSSAPPQPASPPPASGPNQPKRSSVPRTTASALADLYHRKREALHAGSARAKQKQQGKGSKTARERIDLLLDAGSFVELDELVRHHSTNFGQDRYRPYGDGVVTGYGTVNDRPVCVYSQDVTVFGGALGEAHGQKIVKVMDLAGKVGCPIIGINEGAGGRLQEGVMAQAAYGEIFLRNTHLSGVVPQLSLIMGSCAGGACYSPALTDFIVMVDKKSTMFITGPEVIKAVNGEDVDLEELGGGRTNSTKSGNSHYLATDEEDAISFAQELLAFLPANNLAEPPVFARNGRTSEAITARDRELDTLIPDSPHQPYDMHEVLIRVLDDGEFLEVHELFAPNVIVGFGRVDGHSVGVVANQPTQFAGCLDIDASEKAARFVRTCDAFNVAVLTFADVPGFLPGTDQEWNGIIHRGAKLIYAYAEATVPLVTVITRKAYGGAYDVMGSKHLGADINLAWPTAQIAVMGAQGASSIVHRRTLAQAAADGKDVDALRALLRREYEDTLCNPYVAAEHGYVDSVIRPACTRGDVARALRMLRNKRKVLPHKKHGNIPL